MKCHILFALALVALPGCAKKSAEMGGGGFAIPVRTATATKQALEEKISLVATLSANEALDVQSRFEGAIAKIDFEEGAAVKQGDPLFDLDTGKLEATLAEAEANLKLMKITRDRADNMLKNQTISQQEYDQATMNYDASRAAVDLARQRMKDAHIVAEFDGMVGARMVSVGQVITPQTVLTHLVDMDPIKVEFRVPERFLRELQVGQAVEFRVAAYPDRTFKGAVYFIDPQVDLTLRTVLVKARSPNGDHLLRPGMFGNLDLITHIRDAAVVVPETAIFMQGDQAMLYQVDAEGKAQLVNVVLGVRQAGNVEVSSGLEGGETVIVEGIQKIRPGAPVAAQPAS